MGIFSKPSNDKYREEWERIFRRKVQSPPVDPKRSANESKSSFLAGGHHDGTMQTTEEEAEANRKLPAAHFPPDYK